MRSLKGIGILVCVLAVTCLVSAKNDLGIHDVSNITFTTPTRVGTALLLPGEYVVRHTMEGQEHVMVFAPLHNQKDGVKAKCKLVPLARKADQSMTTFEVNAAKERVLHELVVRGDTAKHVFE